MINKIKRSISNPRLILVYLLKRTTSLWSDKAYLKLMYYLSTGQNLNLKVPKKFTEKIQWLKLYYHREEYTRMVDKVAVKKYVSSIIGEEYVIPTIGIWQNFEDIDLNKLPEQFVLKTSHGGGSCGVVVCRDKKNFNLSEAKLVIEKSFCSDIYKYYREWPYKNVPKCIIAEKFLTNGVDKDLTDYKFFCFSGQPYYCQVIRDRHIKETIDFYDMNWVHQDFVGLNPDVRNGGKPVDKPAHLGVMIEICEKLAKDIPFVRVDLYEVEGRVYFGELTFYPASGLGKFKPEEWNKKLGSLLKLPIKQEI